MTPLLMKSWSWNIKRQFTVGHVWKVPLPARSCCVSSVHSSVFYLALLKLSFQQGINWKKFNYSLSTLHQGCPGRYVQATYQPLWCSAQNCWHPWVLSLSEKWPICVPCLTSQPFTGASRLGSGCWVPSSSGLPDSAAHPGSWGLTKHQIPTKGLDPTDVEPALWKQSYTCRE